MEALTCRTLSVPTAARKTATRASISAIRFFMKNFPSGPPGRTQSEDRTEKNTSPLETRFQFEPAGDPGAT